ncbi:MAG TPA: hypothetical protein VNG33_13120, partial [Polyangiaceae bacterium]|nr:hypothetical protein [Polyangiaceae bacterium]
IALGALLTLFLACPAQAEPVTRTFALVVANNRSLSLALPDLQYADDDAARYYRLFRASGAGANVELLTTFDRMSAQLYPALKDLAHPATQAELLRAASKLQKAVRAAHALGERTQLYFVFAGHGEVAGGRGYLHLEDTRIDGGFIEREIIEKIPADTKHVLLDSCNSFFVINPRKPGGRRWATPQDMALGFSARHPEVGLFLSTNSDEEVFEWSELESGVFSHEVRSGLTGAADVNRDGKVTYAELAGFVSEANRGIPRESLRPQIFVSGPRGNQQANLFSTRALQGRHVTLAAGQARIWVRDASGERLVDLHKERGELAVTLPESEQELSIFVQTAAVTSSAPPTLVEHRFASGSEPIALNDSPAEQPRLAARGDQLFGSLFASPYGPAAYATYLKTSSEQPAPVFGVRDDDITRMGNYLTALADVDRTQRRSAGFAFGVTGLFTVGAGVAGQFSNPKMSKGLSIGFASAGALFGAGGLYLALSDGPGEKARQTFEAELRAQRGNRSLAFVHTEERLQDVARAEKSRRQLAFWLMQSLSVAIASATTIGLVVDDKRQAGPYALLYGSAALTSGLGFYVLSMETPTERLLRLYHDDPGLKLRVGVSALPTGGATFGLSGTF